MLTQPEYRVPHLQLMEDDHSHRRSRAKILNGPESRARSINCFRHADAPTDSWQRTSMTRDSKFDLGCDFISTVTM
ncbi:hypothetical protein ABIC65_001669 [Sphingomonas trueperi]|uniref:hypothetical protein n=1 Tax=Sphingomonas trueperi TaxID=53317 RepID=UPI003399C722